MNTTAMGDSVLPAQNDLSFSCESQQQQQQQQQRCRNGDGECSSSSSSLLLSLSSLDDQLQAVVVVTLVAKFGKERITLENLDAQTTTIGHVKGLLHQQTRVLPKRQKLVGLVALQGGAKGVHDDLPLSELKSKNNKSTITHQFILMGTPEEAIFVDPSERDDLPDVLDDFGLEFNAGSDEWCVLACVLGWLFAAVDGIG